MCVPGKLRRNGLEKTCCFTDVSQRPGNPQDEVLRAGAEADFGAPDAEAGTDVIVGSPPPVASPGLFVHSIGQPGQRPDRMAGCVKTEKAVKFD